MPKPLRQKAYGSIPHLPGSRRGTGDHGVSAEQGALVLEKTRDKSDRVIVEEKLDGSCVAVANIDGGIVALGRAGHPARSSPYEQHHLFAEWVDAQRARFLAVLPPDSRLCGEWLALALAHGTRYQLRHEPFVVFDWMRGHTRAPHDALNALAREVSLVRPQVLYDGLGACSIERAEAVLGPDGGHGAQNGAEGAVWRLEREGAVSFLAKYVRPGKADGVLLPELNGGISHWNWRPSSGTP